MITFRQIKSPVNQIARGIGERHWHPLQERIWQELVADIASEAMPVVPRLPAPGDNLLSFDPHILGLPHQVEKMVNWQGIKDLSAVFQIYWSETEFLLLLQVTDDCFKQPFRAGEMWRGDSVQLAIASEQMDGQSITVHFPVPTWEDEWPVIVGVRDPDRLAA